MYSVESEQHALDQVAALPAEALPRYAELMTVLETAPWGGEAYDRQRPDGNMRTYLFGQHGQGIVIYLIEQRPAHRKSADRAVRLVRQF